MTEHARWPGGQEEKNHQVVQWTKTDRKPKNICSVQIVHINGELYTTSVKHTTPSSTAFFYSRHKKSPRGSLVRQCVLKEEQSCQRLLRSRLGCQLYVLGNLVAGGSSISANSGLAHIAAAKSLAGLGVFWLVLWYPNSQADGGQ